MRHILHGFSCGTSTLSVFLRLPLEPTGQSGLCDTSHWTGYQQTFSASIPVCPFQILPPQTRRRLLWWYLLHLCIFHPMVATMAIFCMLCFLVPCIQDSGVKSRVQDLLLGITLSDCELYLLLITYQYFLKYTPFIRVSTQILPPNSAIHMIPRLSESSDPCGMQAGMHTASLVESCHSVVVNVGIKWISICSHMFILLVNLMALGFRVDHEMIFEQK